MVVKRILMLITIVVVLAAGICCVSSCRRSHPEGLCFVSAGEFRPQSVSVSLVVVTHGWVKKGKGGWPEDMAVAIDSRVDPNLWLCGYFDWRKGARTINPTDAAEYARDIAGTRLAEEVLQLGVDLEHIHLIGHSGGCWAVSEAAKILAEKTAADIHLTLFDAYIPSGWQEGALGDVNVPVGRKFWAEHYYTRDYTLGWTEYDLTFAHNVDITKIDRNIKDHNFPWKWYYATITGRYPKGHFLDNGKPALIADGIEYGFARSKEASGAAGWQVSLQLEAVNKAVAIERTSD